MQTPYYVIHKKELEDNLEDLKKSIRHYWKNFIIGYSFKTNSLPWVITFMKSQECFAEVVSDDEYMLAKYLGYSSREIIYNGPVKSKETFIEAVNQGAIVNIDSKREIEWLSEIDHVSTCKIGIRVNFNIEKECPGETQCQEDDGRFGFCYENGELELAWNMISKLGIIISGVHLHCSSRTRSLAIYSAIARKTAELIERYNLQLDYIDIGGGFFGGMPEKPSFNDYMKVISENLKPYLNEEKTTLIFEPGISVIGACLDYRTTVIDTKSSLNNHFIITDGSRTNIDPLMTKQSYYYKVLQKTEGRYSKVKRQTICGFTCMEHDRLFQIENAEEIKVGDQIIYHKTGAYTLSLTPLFIQFFPPVYVKDGEKYTCIRRRWKVDDFIAGNTLYNEVES